MIRYPLSRLFLGVMVIAAGASTSCGGCAKTGSIQGRIASGEGFGQAQSALKEAPVHKSGLGRLQQALSLDGVSVDLLRRIGDEEYPGDYDNHADGYGDGRWVVEETVEPEADGSFAFSEISPGNYALRIDQPEFGGVAYGADGTDFHLEPGQSVSLILPLVSSIEFDAPGLITSSADTAIIDEESGLIIGGGGGLWTLDPDSEVINALFSSTLFASAQDSYSHHLVAYASDRNEAFVIFANRIIAVELSIFDVVEAGQALDYDDPEVRMAIGNKVRWRFIDPAMTEHMSAFLWGPIDRRNALRWFFSADESLFYVTVSHGTHGFEERVMVVETDTLNLRRMIFGEVIAYNAHVDQLVLRTEDGLVLVDASAMRDVAEVEVESDLGVAPVPDSGEYYVAYTKLAADDTPVPFIAVVDDEGEIISNQRASELLGMDYDPKPGASWFDSTGEYFMLGTQGFRLLDGGGFEHVGLTVPLGQFFENRVGCNAQRVFDPVNRYEIWFDCEGGAMALISTDRGNIPISIRVNSANVLLHPSSGRAFVLDDDNNLSVVHYADPMAAERSSFTRLVTGEEHLGPGEECSADEPCSFEEVCVGRTDTAWTGHCMENVRNPFLIYCGGLTGVQCDDGYTCELFNPTNPDSPGLCKGCPHRDYENHGPRCGPGGECIAGFSCNDEGRCVPRGCMNDDECENGEICGMVRDVGRVCLTPGLLQIGETCRGPGDCVSGACVDTDIVDNEWLFQHLGAAPFRVCSEICRMGSDCPEGFDCIHLDTAWPVCVHTEWPLGTITPGAYIRRCWPGCADNEICRPLGHSDPGECRVGFIPGVLECSKPGWGQGVGWECDHDSDCALPASCIPLSIWRDDGTAVSERICGFPCSRGSDCPWDADCINGTCNVVATYYESQEPYYCEDGQGCPDDKWCLGLVYPSAPFHCVKEQPCYSDSECEDELVCHGICTHACATGWDAAPDECREGLQCVYDAEGGISGPLCLPPVCDCPDTGGPTAICRLDTRDCSFRQTCAPALCDGTYGPPDPNDPEERTCCRPGNPCGLSQEQICQCPPDCDFWTADYCCHHGEICPSVSNPASLCPDGYECRLTDHGDSVYQAYGFLCVVAG